VNLTGREKYNLSKSKPEYQQWVLWLQKQEEFAADSIRPFMRCACRKKLELKDSYRCLYCKEWFCEQCAEEHFGKTVEEYWAEKIDANDLT
jgi:formylmethanofuran dehydrogenase subunit E